MAPSQATDGYKSQLGTAPRHRFAHGFDLPYATFAPMHYEPGYAYPLIVWLHDSDSNEQELRQVMPLVSMRNYVAIAPRGTSEGSRQRGRFDWRQTSDAIESVPRPNRRLRHHCAGAVQHPPAANLPRRPRLRRHHGFTNRLECPRPLRRRRRHQRPAAPHSSPMRRVNELRQLPCLLATSRDHLSYPSAQVCQDLRLLHIAGCTVALRQYPGSDYLTSNMLSDLDRWLMELVCVTHSVSKPSC